MVRRFLIRDLMDETECVSFPILQRRLQGVLGGISEAADDDKNKHSPLEISFYYKDSDKDKVVISTTRELKDAIDLFAEQGSLKLFVDVAEKETSTVPIRQGGRTLEDQLLASEKQKSAQIIADASVTSKIFQILGEKKIMPRPFLVEFKGNLVNESTKAVLTHIVDKFQDHVTPTFCPDFGQITKVNDQKLMASYKINGRLHRAEYFAIDSIFLDMTDFIDMTSVSICMSEGVFLKLCQSLAPDISFNSKFKNRLRSITVNIREDNPPVFTTFVPQPDKVRSILVQREGPLTEFLKCPEKRHLYKITGFFTGRVMCSFGAYYYDLTLVGMRVFSIHDELIQKDEVRGL
jgi:hypothetical protein